MPAVFFSWEKRKKTREYNRHCPNFSVHVETRYDVTSTQNGIKFSQKFQKVDAMIRMLFIELRICHGRCVLNMCYHYYYYYYYYY